MRAPLIACVLLLATPALAFETNGRHWPSMPIPYRINLTGAPDFGGGATAEEVVATATAAWEAVPCSEATFSYEGPTDATWAKDGQSTIFWVTDKWMFDKGAAGATLWIPTPEGEPMEVDLALNAVDFKWVIGGGDALTTDIVDPSSVITHELGHWLGLAHSPHQFATMYQAMLPNGAQLSLSADDKWGVCSLYPTGEDECGADADCPDGQLCETLDGVSVCAEQQDPMGAFCGKHHINCKDQCLISFYECSSICVFTSTDYEEGYCAPLCSGGTGCDDGWTCTEIAQYDIEVCLLDPEKPPPDADAGAHEDAGATSDAGTSADTVQDTGSTIEDIFGPEDTGSGSDDGLEDSVGAPDTPAATDTGPAPQDAVADAGADTLTFMDSAPLDAGPETTVPSRSSASDSGCSTAQNGSGGALLLVLLLAWMAIRREAAHR